MHVERGSEHVGQNYTSHKSHITVSMKGNKLFIIESTLEFLIECTRIIQSWPVDEPQPQAKAMES
jgi:hypothetical protein